MDETLKQRDKKAMPVSPGRPKGVPNKTTAILKDAILQAATDAGEEGGLVGYLQKQAIASPGPFLALLGKVLPLQVVGDSENPLRIHVTIGGDARNNP